MTTVGLIDEDLEQLGIRLVIFEEFNDRFRLSSELEYLVALQGRLGMVVVGVKGVKARRKIEQTALTVMG